VTDEHDVGEVELGTDLQDVADVAVERGVLGEVVRGDVRATGPHVVEQHAPMRRRERGRHEPPHVLVAPEAVGEHDRPTRGQAPDGDVVPDDGAHGRRG